MKKIELEGMLNFLATRKDEAAHRGNYSESLYQAIAQLVIAQQLMLLVEHTTKKEVDHRVVAEDIIAEFNNASGDMSHVEDDGYRELVSSLTELLAGYYK